MNERSTRQSNASSVLVAHATATVVVVVARASSGARETGCFIRLRLPRVVIRAVIRVAGVDRKVTSSSSSWSEKKIFRISRLVCDAGGRTTSVRITAFTVAVAAVAVAAAADCGCGEETGAEPAS